MSHSQRVVCVSSSGFHVCAMGRARLGPPRQVPTKPDAPCSFAALRRGPGSVSWMVAAVWARCCAPGHQHSQPAERQELFSRPGTWDRPLSKTDAEVCAGGWKLGAGMRMRVGLGPSPGCSFCGGRGGALASSCTRKHSALHTWPAHLAGQGRAEADPHQCFSLDPVSCGQNTGCPPHTGVSSFPPSPVFPRLPALSPSPHPCHLILQLLSCRHFLLSNG